MKCVVLTFSLLASFSSVASAADLEPPVIEHAEVTMVAAGKPVVIRARIRDESGIFDPTVLFRIGDSGDFERLSMQADPVDPTVFVATIPADLVTGGVQYFIEAFDNEGNGPAQFGSVDLPVQVRVVPKRAAAAGSAMAGGDVDKRSKASDSGAAPAGPSSGGVGTASAPSGDLQPGDDEGSGGMLWLGLGGAAAVVLMAAAIGGGGFAYYRFFRSDPTVDNVRIVVDGPLPIAGAR